MSRLDMDPQYQRKSTWNDEYKRFFVDTILHNYPCPTIFLVKEYNSKYEPVYAVVDGKQRLTTIFRFYDGELTTSENNTEPILSEKYFEEIGEFQRVFLDYKLTVEVLDKTTTTELKEAFDRMNRNVSKLNAQELRHARFSGRFINFCETWVQNPYFQASTICSQKRSDRMADVEYISELVVLTERGIQNGKDILDNVYAEYDEEIPNEAELYAQFEHILNIVKGVGLSDTGKAPFGSLSDIYSLWAAIREVLQENCALDIERSRELLIALSEEADKRTTQDGIDYFESSQRQTNSSRSRQKRTDIIKKRLVIK